MASHGRYRQAVPQTHDQPPIQHLGQLPPAVLQRPAGRPNAREFANLAVEGFFIVDLFVVRPVQGRLHVFINQLAPRSVPNCVYSVVQAARRDKRTGAGRSVPGSSSVPLVWVVGRPCPAEARWRGVRVGAGSHTGPPGRAGWGRPCPSGVRRGYV